MEIVIDKSYLQGASSEEVRLLCNNYTALFTETLFYELLTAPKAERDACFAKLPVRDNPVALIPRTGPLFRHEVENRRAASPVLEHRLNFTFRFNPRLKRRTFHHSQKEQATLAEWRREVDREVATFHEVATGVSSWCPALKACPGNARKSACKDLKRQACIDTEVIRKVYQSIKPDGFPALLFSIFLGRVSLGSGPPSLLPRLHWALRIHSAFQHSKTHRTRHSRHPICALRSTLRCPCHKGQRHRHQFRARMSQRATGQMTALTGCCPLFP